MKKILLFTQIATLVVLLCACGGKNKASSALNGEIIPMKYAENLTLIKGEGYTEAILRNPWDTTAILRTYLLIDKDQPVPDHLPEGTIVRTPLSKALVYTATHTPRHGLHAHGAGTTYVRYLGWCRLVQLPHLPQV